MPSTEQFDRSCYYLPSVRHHYKLNPSSTPRAREIAHDFQCAASPHCMPMDVRPFAINSDCHQSIAPRLEAATSPSHRYQMRLPPVHCTAIIRAATSSSHRLQLAQWPRTDAIYYLETIHVRFEHDHIEKHCIHHQVPWKNWSYAKRAPLDSHTQNVDPTEMS